MKIYLSGLTVYTYSEDIRKALNIEEVNKFLKALKIAGSVDKGIVFSYYTKDEISKILENFSAEERTSFDNLLEKLEKFNFIKVDLTDYEKSYQRMYEVVEDLIESHIPSQDIILKVNVSCGHKMGALALYLSIMNLVHSKKFYKYLSIRNKENLVVDVYHAEKDVIEKLPTINFESEKKGEWEEYLKYLSVPMNYDDFKKKMKSDGDRPIMYLSKHKYIEMKNNMVYLTVRGKTFLKLMDKL